MNEQNISTCKKISFVIPCYRSENTIAHVTKEIQETVENRNSLANGEFFDYEIILVNDCSPDNVWEIIKELSKQNPKIKGICLAKNFGQHSALMAGYGSVTGDYIISLDDDGQTPANESFKLVDKLEEGFDVVYGFYDHSVQHPFRRLGSWVNKKMAENIIGQPKTLRTTSFFIMKKFITDEIVRYPHPFAYISGLIFRATKNISNIAVNHRKRLIGKSGYTIAGLISLWVNGFTAFSVKPLRAATFIGCFCAILGFVAGLFVIYKKMMYPEVPVGYTSILATMLFIGGMIMLLLGLIGEYVGRIYISINQSPQYVIREKI